MERPSYCDKFAPALLRLDPRFDRDPDKIDVDDKKKEAALLAEYMPRVQSGFTADYHGSHFQNLPPEILQAIAIQTSIPAIIWPGGTTISHHLARFRTICRETSEAGKAVLIRLSKRERDFSPKSLYLPLRPGRTFDDVLRIFQNTGIGEVVRELEFFTFPVITNTTLQTWIQDLINDGLSGHEARTENSIVVSKEVVRTFTPMIAHQKDFFNVINSKKGFEKLVDILDCMPNLRELHFRVMSFWSCHRAPEALIHLERFVAGHERERAKVIHWGCFPRILEIIKRYSISKVTLEADSCMFGDRCNQPSILPRISDATLVASCASITDLRLNMTPMDLMSLGRYDRDDPLPLKNADRFHTFLASAPNLRKLNIGYSRDAVELGEIDSLWLRSVLRDQFFPKLVMLEVSHAQIEADIILPFVTRHKDTLEALAIWAFYMPTPRDLVDMLNGLRALQLSLLRCEIQVNDFYDNDVDGKSDLYDIVRQYKESKSLEMDFDTEESEFEDDYDFHTPELDNIDPGLYALGKETTGRYLDDALASKEYATLRDELKL